MKIFILLITFYSSISFGACVPGNIACQNAEIQYFKGQTAPYATPSAGFANLYFDQSVSQGITPRWQDSLATVYPIIGKIVSNRTIYVATTGNDTTGTGLIGAPYLTPQKALDYLSNFLIAPGVEVIISLAAGQYILTSSIVPQHPQGAQITIQGATVATPPVAADFCTPGTIPGRGWSNSTAAQRETCANTDLTMLRGKYPTELRFNGNLDGIIVKGSDIKISNLLISSIYLPNTAATANTRRGISVGYDTSIPSRENSATLISIGPISVHGFGAQGIMAITGSTISNNSTTSVSNVGTYGYYAQFSSSLSNNGPVIASNNGTEGLRCENSSSMYYGNIVNSINNGNIGIYSGISSSIYIAGTTNVINNGGTGTSITIGSSFQASTINSNNNGIHGYICGLTSICNLGVSNFSNNALYGVRVYYSSTSYGIDMTANNNGGFGVDVEFAAFIRVIGTFTSISNAGTSNVYVSDWSEIAFTGVPNVGSYSPALGVLGNFNSGIYNH